MSTMPIKYAVPAGNARIKLLIALAARYPGWAARGWNGWDGLDTHPAFQISDRFCYSFGKTRVFTTIGMIGLTALLPEKQQEGGVLQESGLRTSS